MRLSKELINHIANAVAANLETKHLAEYDARAAVVSLIADVMTADLLAEDKLNADVEKLLAAYESDIAKGQMDYRKVFELTKQKLAKERGMVL